jgi:hypothetical protein
VSVRPECMEARRELLFISAVCWGSLLGTGLLYLTIFYGLLCACGGFLLSFYVRCLGTCDRLEDRIGLDCVGVIKAIVFSEFGVYVVSL